MNTFRSKLFPLYPVAEPLVRLTRSFLGRQYPLQRHESYGPFFIVGSPRSGNTLLRRILQASEQVHIPPETHVLGDVISLFQRNRNMRWSELVHLILATFEYHQYFSAFEISLRPLANRLRKAREESRSLAFILDSIYRYHGEQVGKTFERWGDKTPTNCYSLNRVLPVFPDAKFVNLFRDGVDAVYSLIKSRIHPDLSEAAARWASSIVAIRDFARHHAPICFEIRYEDLVANPVSVVGPLCEFLDIRFDPSMIESLGHKDTLKDVTTATHSHFANVLKPITTSSVGKGRRNLTAAEKASLQPMIGHQLEQLSYPPLM